MPHVNEFKLDKIKGALYGFALGDAMGATTEFMSERAIRKKYGSVTTIMGGGWLHLKPGQVTDDTQMMLCVAWALKEPFETINGFDIDVFLRGCCHSFVEWYRRNPKDIGNTTLRVLRNFSENGWKYTQEWFDFARNSQSLGNGSLMRALPPILLGLPEDFAIYQGRLTHNNASCDTCIQKYSENLKSLMCYGAYSSYELTLFPPEGHVINTLNNALFWSQHTYSVKDAIIAATNNGGDADTIAAITGSLSGVMYGYDSIPQELIDILDPNVKKEIDSFVEMWKKYTFTFKK